MTPDFHKLAQASEDPILMDRVTRERRNRRIAYAALVGYFGVLCGAIVLLAVKL